MKRRAQMGNPKDENRREPPCGWLMSTAESIAFIALVAGLAALALWVGGVEPSPELRATWP